MKRLLPNEQVRLVGGFIVILLLRSKTRKKRQKLEKKKKAEKLKNWEINRTHFQSSLKERISVYIIAQVKQGHVEQ